MISSLQLEDFVRLCGLRMSEEVPGPIRQFPLRDGVPPDLMREASLNFRRPSRIGLRRNRLPGGYEAHDPVRAHFPGAGGLVALMVRGRPGFEAAVWGKVSRPILPSPCLAGIEFQQRPRLHRRPTRAASATGCGRGRLAQASDRQDQGAGAGRKRCKDHRALPFWLTRGSRCLHGSDRLGRLRRQQGEARNAGSASLIHCSTEHNNGQFCQIR